MSDRRVGVIGATSFVGGCLLPLLTGAKWQVTAFSRRVVDQVSDGVVWRRLPLAVYSSCREDGGVMPLWICVAPIWVLPGYFDLLEALGARRVVVVSSTSRFTKDDSSDPQEQAVARRLATAEACVQEWAESRGVEWVILRPTLIYGFGRDRNIAEIARFIQRFGFFPLFGAAQGLRQPVHAEDVASACIGALVTSSVANRAYNISGGEVLPYRTMVSRVFAALGRLPKFFSVPLSAFQMAVTCLQMFPRFKHWSAAMAERMNCDLVFDHSDATRDFGYTPRGFVISVNDIKSEL